LGAVPDAFAAGAASRGQVIYIPAYSEIPYGDRGNTINLTVALSVRNTDHKHSFTVRKVEYHGSTGALVRTYLQEPLSIKPLASAEFIVKESDRSGGISASFIVEWDSTTPISQPVVEAVMIGTASTQGISFTSPGRVIREKH
jgi:hypothetical protein